MEEQAAKLWRSTQQTATSPIRQSVRNIVPEPHHVVAPEKHPVEEAVSEASEDEPVDEEEVVALAVEVHIDTKPINPQFCFEEAPRL